MGAHRRARAGGTAASAGSHAADERLADGRDCHRQQAIIGTPGPTDSLAAHRSERSCVHRGPVHQRSAALYLRRAS